MLTTANFTNDNVGIKILKFLKLGLSAMITYFYHNCVEISSIFSARDIISPGDFVESNKSSAVRIGKD